MYTYRLIAGKAEYTSALSQLLTAEGCKVSQVIISHHHRDHVGGIPDVKSICGADVPGACTPYQVC